MQNELAGLLGPLDSINYVQQQGQQGKLNRLTELARQSYTVAPDQQKELLGDMAEVNPQFAAAQQKQFQEQDDRRMQKLGGAARYLEQARKTGNPAWVQGAWNSVRPMLQHEIPEANYPEQWDDATMAPTLYQALALTGGMGNGKVHSNHIGSDGYIYNVYSDGRIESTGVRAAPSTQIVKTADGRLVVVNKNNGPAGEGTPVHAVGIPAYDASSIQQGYSSGYQTEPPTGYQQQPAPLPYGGLNPNDQQGQTQSTGANGQMSPGQAQPTQTSHTPGVVVENKELNPEIRQQLSTTLSSMRQLGIPDNMIDNVMSHVLSRAPMLQSSATPNQASSVNGPRGGMTPQDVQQSLSTPFPSPQQEAYLKESGKHQANLNYLSQERSIESQSDVDKSKSIEENKSEIRNREDAEKQKREFEKQLPQLNNLERGFDRLKEVMDKIHQHPFFATGPMTGWFLKGTDLGNGLVSARDSILNSYMALTRIAGSGAVSDKDIDTIKNQLPSLENYSDANYKTLEQLRSTIQDYKQRMSPQGASSQNTSGQPVPVTNPKGKLTDEEILKLYGH